MAEDFALYECSLVRLATGRTLVNLREALEALRSASAAVLEHHMMRCALEDHFELYEFPNDLARWCWDSLGERDLAEELALVNPYAFSGLEELRRELVEMLEGHLWGSTRATLCRPGMELSLVESRLITFDTNERYGTLAALAQGVQNMSRRSLYYHFHEAYRRHGGDDFSDWLERKGGYGSLVATLRQLDFYSLSLTQLRETVIAAMRDHLVEPQAVLGRM